MNSFSDFFCCKCAVNSHMPELTHLCHEVDGTQKYIPQQLGKGLLKWHNAEKC